MSDDEDVTVFLPVSFARLASTRARAPQMEHATPLVSLTSSFDAPTSILASASVAAAKVPCVGSKSAGETYFGDTFVGSDLDESAPPVAESAPPQVQSSPAATVSPTARTSAPLDVRVKALLRRLVQTQGRFAPARAPHAAKLALSMLGLFLGVVLAVVARLGSQGGATVMPEVQKTSNQAVAALNQVKQEPARVKEQVPLAEKTPVTAPILEKKAVSNAAASDVAQPHHLNEPMNSAETNSLDEQKNGRPSVMSYIISKEYTARAKQALLWTLSGECERSLVSYHDLSVDDEENSALYETLLVEAKRRCALRDVQP